MTLNSLMWIGWAIVSLVGAGCLYTFMFVSGPQSAFLMGETTSAHHQIEVACKTCHTAPFFATEVKASKAMNKACLSCHKDELEVSNDSHPVKKFRGPEKIRIRENLDALYCATCHLEHTPEVTGPMMVTLPTDFCSACHQEVGKDRPSHEGLGFETCASSGCHNFHDNTALYEKFLVKHADVPDFKEVAVSGYAAEARSPSPIQIALNEETPVKALEAYFNGLEEAPEDPLAEATAKIDAVLIAKDAIAPQEYMDASAVALWAGSEHALAGVNCAGCHAPEQAEAELTEIASHWIEAPGPDVCATCHKNQAKSFSFGKHGMNLHPEIAAPREAPTEGIAAYLASLAADPRVEAFSVGQSKLPMQSKAHDAMLGTCSNCHKPHEQDLAVAVVEACTSCHADEHTKNYEGSPHHELWLAELAGTGEPGSGVTCADCHMPKLEHRREGFVTTHNQNAYLRPNEKMIRPVCMSCHSLAFSIDALADETLIENNFRGRPTVHIESVDWATKRVEKTE